MWLTPNFTLAELTVSETAVRYGINNEPSSEILENLKKLATSLEQVRTLIGNRPIFVTSGYRSPAVNKAVGGAKNSSHMSGFAADINASRLTPRQFATMIVESDIVFDQVILEFDRWVHFGLAVSPRKQVLTAKRIDGKTVYLSGIV